MALPFVFVPRRISLWGGIVVLLLANGLNCPLHAEEPENAAPEALLKPWTDATVRFQKSRETASEGLIRLLDGAEEKARASGDLEKVKSIKQERAQFLQEQTLPKCIKTATYEKALDAANASLRTAAQKTKVALVRQKFDEDAATIDQELGELVGPAKLELVKGKAGASGPPDGRIYWVEKKEKGNEFRWMKPLEWIETTHDGTNKRYQFKEVARTTDYVEIHDSIRDIGVRLLRKSAERAMDYRLSEANAFSSWTEGAWVVEPSDVIYLTDLPEKVLRAQSFDKYGMVPVSQGREQIYLGNRPSPKGLFTHPATKDVAVVSYEIGALRKNVFRAHIGVADSRQYDPATPLKFVVLGDGKKLYTSEPVKKWGVPQECEIQVRGVNELVLRVECDGPYDFAFAVWCEPRLSAK
ncbi:MAG: hypothetical protein JWP89_5523 [Schlesneria sp.]|nr:hypothetical protein [Schlesneria sp.]